MLRKKTPIKSTVYVLTNNLSFWVRLVIDVKNNIYGRSLTKRQRQTPVGHHNLELNQKLVPQRP